ncbi:MAG: MarR family transcriptional regulator [Calditrichaeota bacterium]|nr:MarR family transcriptional regulator [Calditrichota bacterium]
MRLEDELKTSFFDPIIKAQLNILFTGNWLNEQINQFLKPFNISDQQYNVLRILRGQKDQAVNLYSIQERMIHRMSNATRLVEKLRQKKLVERAICNENRRKVEIRITEAGLKLLDEIEPLLRENHTILSNKITKEEAKQISFLLEKLRQ